MSASLKRKIALPILVALMLPMIRTEEFLTRTINKMASAANQLEGF